MEEVYLWTGILFIGAYGTCVGTVFGIGRGIGHGIGHGIGIWDPVLVDTINAFWLFPLLPRWILTEDNRDCGTRERES